MNDDDSPYKFDGPGGSGKNFLFTTLISVTRGQGKNVLPLSTTGTAATLLKGGCTVHSGLKLPVPLIETSVSPIRLTSPEAELSRIVICIFKRNDGALVPFSYLVCLYFLKKSRGEKPIG